MATIVALATICPEPGGATPVKLAVFSPLIEARAGAPTATPYG
jgi:hypothetical protein